VRQLKNPDGSTLRTGRGYAKFQAIAGKKDLAYAGIYAHVAFKLWLRRRRIGGEIGSVVPM